MKGDQTTQVTAMASFTSTDKKIIIFALKYHEFQFKKWKYMYVTVTDTEVPFDPGVGVLNLGIYKIIQ